MAPDTTAGWKKGRGKIGVLEPLIGSWQTEADSPMGPIRASRTFSRILQGKCVLLEAQWRLPDDKVYEEHAIYAIDDAGKLAFWSFTSDGKRSQGVIADGADVYPDAIAFEAQMDAGLARMVYWPAEAGRVNWVVESKTKKGWNRFVHHVYARV